MDYSFAYCKSLIFVSIPSNVTNIGKGCFNGCSSLEQISIPSSVTNIDYSTFENCSSLKQISIPPSVTRINLYTFCNCTSLTLFKAVSENRRWKIEEMMPRMQQVDVEAHLD